MQEDGFKKREILRMALLAPLGAMTARSAAAQSDSIFGVPVPRRLLDFIPAKPLNIARTVEKVIQLEKEADLKKLPESVLSRGKGEPFVLDDGYYQKLLPRLVALVDRSELRDIGLAEQAGGLLSELNGAVREIPEGLRLGTLLGEASPDVGGNRFGRLNWAAPDDPIADAVITLSKSRSYADLKDEYLKLYQSMKLRPTYSETVDWHLKLIRNSKVRYDAVGQTVGVPWYFIAVIHGLEASFNFRAHLHNGDFPLSARTRQIPSGRPLRWLPPSDWESSARDAIRILGFADQSDWSVERTLYRLEAYNGMGYRNFQVASPYLWSFSNHYSRGKYVSDGKWSANAKSQQCGAVVMLKGLEEAGDFSWPTA